MKYVFFALFAAASTLHLYYSWKEQDRNRAYTKPFLLFFLLLFYLTASKHIMISLVLAIFTSWLGDVLLIPKNVKCFAIGGLSFLIAHVLFIWVYIHRIEINGISWIILIVAALIYVFFGTAVMVSIRHNISKFLIAAMYFYLIANSIMNVSALRQLLFLRSGGAAVSFIGAVLFYVSDCLLFLVRFHENSSLIYKRHFPVMLTYLMGELLIVFGNLMIEAQVFG